MDVVFMTNGLDLHSKLSTYSVRPEIKYGRVVTTMDNTEHSAKGTRRYIITFSLLPMDEDEVNALYNALSDLVFSVEFTNPYKGGATSTKEFRLVSDMESVFGLKSINGKRYYKGIPIQLRAKYAEN